MSLSPITRLSSIARVLKPGQRYMSDHPEGRSFASVWPNPDWPRPDDHLEPAERAARWAKRLGVRVWEQTDPPALVIERPADIPRWP